jgi:murein DD-endopeptidase MepM/ murein hydrolase activator NlpD
VILPAQVVYNIERYKFEACVIYAITSLTIIVLMQAAAINLPHPDASAEASVDIKYPIVNLLPAASVQYAASTSSTPSAESVWPIHGIVTTEFGASDRPYQTTHTGIDISSARPSGVTPVSSFREGIVIQVVHSSVSYGNHVVIDHGNGLTSLYGHLANTTVRVGQHVKPGDTIGHEGSTGASTGPHVHFEIDLKGKPVSPRRYLTGNP